MLVSFFFFFWNPFEETPSCAFEWKKGTVLKTSYPNVLLVSSFLLFFVSNLIDGKLHVGA